MLVATVAALATSVLAGVLLVPSLRLTGAALAALLASGVLVAVMHRGAQRRHPLELPGRALGKLAVLYVAVLAAGTALAGPSASSVALRVALVVSFPVLLLAVGFFAQGERDSLRRLLQIRRARAA